MANDPGLLLAFASPELHTKSRRTRRRFRRRLVHNVEAALAARAPGATVEDDGRRLLVRAPSVTAAATAASETFGVARVTEVVSVAHDSVEGLIEAVAARAHPLVEGRTFAVRVARRGGQAWSRTDLEARIGGLLDPASAGVDLTNPEAMVRVEAYDDVTWLVLRTWQGPRGLPLATQERTLTLLSGGFDSAVAAWMTMSRGCPSDFLHFRLDCAQSDHALLVARELARRWAPGSQACVWDVDFQTVKQALLDTVHPRYRQVALKQLMLTAADSVAGLLGVDALVTGEAIGQVSSQTLRHLTVVDRRVERMVLRPLVGMDKETIIDRARRIGTHDLSVRAREVCDLSDGPVVVDADEADVQQATRQLPSGLVAQAVATRRVVALDAWAPGIPGVPTSVEPPADAVPVSAATADLRTVLDAHPEPVALAVEGPGAAALATSLQAHGRTVWLVDNSSPTTLEATS